MPYVLKSESDNLRNDLKLVTVGQVNYLFTVEFVRIWKASPSYATFHLISRCIVRPESEPGVYKLEQDLKPFVKETDRLVARTEAVAEFRRRVMVDYENAKINDSNRADPYEELELEAQPEEK